MPKRTTQESVDPTITKLNVAQLKQRLTDLGKDVHGTKPQLVARLEEAQKPSEEAAASPTQSEDDDPNDLSVAQLKEKLAALGQKLQGNKAALVTRLKTAQGRAQSKQQMLEQQEELKTIADSRLPTQVLADGITLIRFNWVTQPDKWMTWSGHSDLVLNGAVYFWEIKIDGLEKDYQYAYTNLGVVAENGDQYYINGNIGEATYHTPGKSCGSDLEHFRVKLKPGDSMAFLLDAREGGSRSLTVFARKEYQPNPLKPNTTPTTAFSSWDRTETRLPPSGSFRAFAEVSQLGVRFKPKFLRNLNDHLFVVDWETVGAHERPRVAVPQPPAKS